MRGRGRVRLSRTRGGRQRHRAERTHHEHHADATITARAMVFDPARRRNFDGVGRRGVPPSARLA